MEGLKICLAILLELILGAVIFYAIIFVAIALEFAIAYLHVPDESFVHTVAHYGENVLLIGDCVIGLIFVTRGIYNAWDATWGS